MVIRKITLLCLSYILLEAVCNNHLRRDKIFFYCCDCVCFDFLVWKTNFSVLKRIGFFRYFYGNLCFKFKHNWWVIMFNLFLKSDPVSFARFVFWRSRYRFRMNRDNFWWHRPRFLLVKLANWCFKKLITFYYNAKN